MLPAAMVLAQAAPPAMARRVLAAAPGAATRGITVNGSAMVRVPATSARVSLQIFSANRALILDRAYLQPLVDALVQAGADPSSVTLPVSFSAPGKSNAASITVRVDHPTAAQMQRAVVSVGAAIASMKDVTVAGAQVAVSAADCSAALETARHQAILNAHAKAESIANDLGVKLGGALAVNSFEQASPDGSCSFQYFVNNASIGPQSPQSPGDYVTVPVTSTLTITYAIK